MTFLPLLLLQISTEFSPVNVLCTANVSSPVQANGNYCHLVAQLYIKFKHPKCPTLPYMRIHLHTNIHIYIQTYTSTCKRTHLHANVHIYMQTYTSTCERTHLHTNVHIYIQTYTSTYKCIHLHTNVYVYIHVAVGSTDFKLKSKVGSAGHLQI